MTKLARLVRLLGASGAVIGCGSMAAMLPSLAASTLGAVGLTGSSAFSRILAPVAEPLFVGSALLFILGAVFCGWAATLLAGGGTLLLYLSMFILPDAHTAGMADMAAPAHGDAPTFWTGLGLMLASGMVTLWRRRRHACRPLIRGTASSI